MSHLSLFNNPLLLGFEQMERTLARVAGAGNGYPPYNIEQIGSSGFRITLAVAGFAANDLQVRVEANQLVIRGKQATNGEARVYLHRGIAARQFQRSFVLADGIEVIEAHLDSGLLRIDIEQPVLEPAVRHVEIKSGAHDESASLGIEAGGSAASREGKTP